MSGRLPYHPQDFQCQVCLASLLDLASAFEIPAFACPNGHQLCEPCLWKLLARQPVKKCPTCSLTGSFQEVPLIARLAEGFFGPCPNGCGESFWGSARYQHRLVTCTHREVDCELCDEPFKAKDLRGHQQVCLKKRLCPRVFFSLGALREAEKQEVLSDLSDAPSVLATSVGHVLLRFVSIYDLKSYRPAFASPAGYVLCLALSLLDASSNKAVRVGFGLPYGPVADRKQSQTVTLRSTEEVSCSRASLSYFNFLLPAWSSQDAGKIEITVEAAS
jgi:hypothetical protein